MAGIGLPPRRSMTAEDIRDLQRRARHLRRASGGRRVPALVLVGHQRGEAIQRAHHLADGIGGDASVERRRLQLGMPERPRVIMRIFYVIETEGSAEQDRMLASAATRSARDKRPRPPP
jgi:hypothetical protein